MRSVGSRSSRNGDKGMELEQRRRELSRQQEHLQVQVDELRSLLVAAFDRIEVLETGHPPDRAA